MTCDVPLSGLFFKLELINKQYMDVVMDFDIITLIQNRFDTSRLRPPRRAEYTDTLRVINEINGLREKINVSVKNEIERGGSRNDIVKSIGDAVAECQKNHAQEPDFPSGVDDVGRDSTTEELPEKLYNFLREVLNGYAIDHRRTIQARIGSTGGFEIIEAPENLEPEKTEEQIRQQLEENENQAEQIEQKAKVLEKHFYEPLRAWAHKHNGAKDFDGRSNCVITGGKLPFPKWENPDLVQVDFSIGEFTKKVDFEITSYEVKLKVEPYAVWQAANYKRFSTYAYVAFAKNESDVREKDEGRVFDIAVDLGIGVLVLDDKNSEGDKITFKEIHAPTRNRPSDIEIDNLLRGYKNIEDLNAIMTQAAARFSGVILPETAVIEFSVCRKTF